MAVFCPLKYVTTTEGICYLRLIINRSETLTFFSGTAFDISTLSRDLTVKLCNMCAPHAMI